MNTIMNNKLKIVFIADCFLEHIKGGGEYCNDVLINLLKKNDHEVITILSNHVSVEFLRNMIDYNFIIGNFLGLSEQCKNFLSKECSYIIYEHDHKYLKSRDPSVYKNYKAPQKEIINELFYNSAICVVGQSKLHCEVMKKNLPNATLEHAGISLWNDEQLDWLENLHNIREKSTNKETVVQNGWSYMWSNISHKNMDGAEKYCTENNLKSVKISGEWNEFTQKMSYQFGFIFFPKTLETMSRVCVEARMLGLKLKGNEKIGAMSEDWFKLKGKELIDHHRQNREHVMNIFVENFQKFDSKQMNIELSDVEDITVILTLYKRPQNLKEQIEVIRNQTVKPKEIWLWINEEDSNQASTYINTLEYPEFSMIGDVSYACKYLNVDKIIDSSHNFKYYGRYSAALLADTKYISIIDDDTIIGEKFFENCLKSMRTKPGIYGSAGVILNNSKYNPHTRIGWPNPNLDITEVDFCGHSSLFERSVLCHLWREKPPTWENGEDIQLSYCAKVYGNISTYVPPHPEYDKSLWGSLKGNELGIDEVASSNGITKPHEQFFKERDECIEHALKNGWQTVNKICL